MGHVDRISKFVRHKLSSYVTVCRTVLG